MWSNVNWNQRYMWGSNIYFFLKIKSNRKSDNLVYANFMLIKVKIIKKKFLIYVNFMIILIYGKIIKKIIKKKKFFTDGQMDNPKL